jgi:anaerobic magnesium-protoporphyrin IX monomethyl ester cyclase
MSRLDVLFVTPNSSEKAYQALANTYSAVEPPTWSLLLAQATRAKGYSVAILDCDAMRLSDESAVEQISYLNPRLVCFVLYGQNPNAGTTSMIGASSLAPALKETCGDIKTAFVGSHVSALPHKVIQYPFVDFVFINEGVYALQQLLATNLRDDLNKVAGIGYRDADGNGVLTGGARLVPQEMMDRDLPGSAWDLLPKEKMPLDLYRAHFWHTNFSHDKRTPFSAIYTSLGCNFGCNFCMINIVNRTDTRPEAHAADFRKMRFWSAELILKEMETLAGFGVETLRLSDEMFFLNRRHYIPILEGIVQRGLKFNMWAYARVDTIRSDQLQLFKKAGVNWLALGIEAGNENVRLDIEKGRFRDVNIRNVVKMVEDHGIEVVGNYIFGFPSDTIETMTQTLNLAMELNTAHANFYPCQALPGSPLYFIARDEGWDLPTQFEEYAFLSYECKPLPTQYLSSAEVLRFRDEAWHKYFANPDYLALVAKKFGPEQRHNVEQFSQIHLKRRLLGD